MCSSKVLSEIPFKSEILIGDSDTCYNLRPLLQGGDAVGMQLDALNGGADADYEAMMRALKKEHYDAMSQLSNKLGAESDRQRNALKAQLAARRKKRVDALLAKGVDQSEAEATAELEMAHMEEQVG